MADIHLKKVPAKLHSKMKKSARENRRSMNSEAIFRLAHAYGMASLLTELELKKSPRK